MKKYATISGLIPEEILKWLHARYSLDRRRIWLFPSYTLGAMYAAQIMATLKKDIDVNICFNQLNLQPIHAWLKTNIWQMDLFY